MADEQGNSGARVKLSAKAEEEKSELLAVLLMAYFGVKDWIAHITSTN